MADAVAEIHRQTGRFDPAVVAAFDASQDEILLISQRFADIAKPTGRRRNSASRAAVPTRSRAATRGQAGGGRRHTGEAAKAPASPAGEMGKAMAYRRQGLPGMASQPQVGEQGLGFTALGNQQAAPDTGRGRRSTRTPRPSVKQKEACRLSTGAVRCLPPAIRPGGLPRANAGGGQGQANNQAGAMQRVAPRSIRPWV